MHTVLPTVNTLNDFKKMHVVLLGRLERLTACTVRQIAQLLYTACELSSVHTGAQVRIRHTAK